MTTTPIPVIITKSTTEAMTAITEAPPSRRSRSAPMEKPEQQDVQSNIYTALIAAQVNFGSLERDADNPYFKSKYLSLAGLFAGVRSALTDQGILVTGRTELVPQGWIVRTTLYHVLSDTSIDSCYPILDTSSNQKLGASTTYGTRYNLLLLLGVASTDDDGNSTSGLAAPDDFLGPPPSGQQRLEPRRLPDPNTQPPANWL